MPPLNIKNVTTFIVFAHPQQLAQVRRWRSEHFVAELKCTVVELHKPIVQSLLKIPLRGGCLCFY